MLKLIRVDVTAGVGIVFCPDLTKAEFRSQRLFNFEVADKHARLISKDGSVGAGKGAKTKETGKKGT